MEAKNKRGAKASETQKIFLVEFLEERPDLANDKFTTADGAHFRDNEWKVLSEKLNGLGGALKDGFKWRKYWKDLTISVRSRDSAIKEQRRKSGINGVIPKRELSEIERRIIGIITTEAVEGVSSFVSEIGFEPIIVAQPVDECPLNVEPATGSHQAAPQGHSEPIEEAVPSTSRRQQKRKKTLSSTTDDCFKFFKEIELKKLKLEERKVELMEESNRTQLEIKIKLDQLLQELQK